MPNETIISEIENMLSEIVSIGGQNEWSKMVPNLAVQDANPTNLDGFVVLSDDRDGNNILAKKVGSVIYTNGDLVNTIFPEGGEAVAFQQGSESANGGGIWEIVPSTTTDIFYDKGDVGIGKSVAPDAALEVLDTAQSQLRLTHTEDTKFVDFTLDTNHDLTIDPSSTGLIKLAADVTVTNLISHEGDLDTELAFTDDDIEFTVGNLSMLKLTEAGQDLITLGPGSGDVDIDFNGDMFLLGSSGFFGIGVNPPLVQLHTNGGRIKNTTRIDDGDSPYTVLVTDEIILADTDGGVITVNLPAGVDGTHYRISNTGSSGNDVTVDPNGAEQLFGGGAGVSFALVDGETINIYFETTENWW